jgi:ABC-type branched-subunit amino acid transport system permease subunit
VQVTLFSVVQGLVAGLLYGLLALGLVLIYRTTRVLNFAQGQLGVIGAVFLLKITFDLSIPYWPALAFVLVLGACFGALCELLLRRLFDRPRVIVMVATIGLSQVLFLFTVLPFVAPSDFFVPYPLPFTQTLSIGGGILQPGEVATLVVAPLVALGLAGFLRYSSWGLGMRAMAENSDSARLSGVWVKRMSTLAWAIAGLLSTITAILEAPGQASALKEALPPGLLLRALAAALIAGMTSLTVAFAAGIAIGIVEQVVNYNLVGDPNKTSLITFGLFVLILVVLLIRVRWLQRGPRSEERSTWAFGGESARMGMDRLRTWVGRFGVSATIAIAVLLPFVLSPGRSFLLARVCIFGVIALSLTLLTGWAGQVSLGQFGLVAVGAIVAARLPDWNLVVLLPFAGAITAIVAIIVGLPALRIRGLYLAVTTLSFALFMQVSVLSTPCWTAPVVGGQVCTGLPDPASTLVARPSFLGWDLSSDADFAWFSLGVLLLAVVVTRTWRDRGIARRLIAVRDNESGAAAMGVPVVRTKLLAFALSGFMAGVAGVCLAFALERIKPSDFAVTDSILVLSMVVIGGLGSVEGAVLGALYLVGLPAALGSTSTIQFITSGFGVLVFLLYLPGGLAELLHRGGDGVATLLERWRKRRDAPPPAPITDDLVTSGADA